MTVSVTSFGFKYGLPLEADLVFDVRFMPNPFYMEDLRPRTGLDQAVADYVFHFPQTQDYMRRLEDLLAFSLPLYAEEGKTSLTIAVGCTGGHHRSVAVTHAPGLIGALLVGVNFAKGLSMAAGLPLIPVHHLRSHIAANYLAHPELKPPFLCLVVSGGHSHIVEVADYTKMRIIGRTRDDAAGEAFDKAARAMGMPYPGGIHLDRIAEEGGDSAFAFPRPRVDGAEYDFSFSGLKTAVINQIHNASQKGVELPVADLAASFRKAVVGCLVQNFQKAAEDFHCTTLVTAGGVSANSLLRSRLEALCGEKGWKLYMPPKELCGDNAAMVGAQGFYEWKAGNRAGLNLNACATMSIEG